MLNVEIIQEIHMLCSLYEKRWGKEVDYIGIPSNCTQEKLVLAMRIIVDTGESVLQGFERVRELGLPFEEYLMEYHGKYSVPNGFVFEKPCPFCRNNVVFYSYGSFWEYRCETKYCFKSTFRGL